MKKGYSQIVLRDSLRKRLDAIRVSIPNTDRKESYSDVISRLLDSIDTGKTAKKSIDISAKGPRRHTSKGGGVGVSRGEGGDRKKLSELSLEEAVDLVQKRKKA